VYLYVINFFIHLYVFPFFAAQRLAAQLLGYFRLVVTILAGKLKPHIGVRSLGLGQSLPPRSKTARFCSLSSFGCEAGVSCSGVLGALHLGILLLVILMVQYDVLDKMN
jgi:hypothetical protein